MPESGDRGVAVMRGMAANDNPRLGGRAARRAMRNLDVIKRTAQKARPVNKGKGVSPNPG